MAKIKETKEYKVLKNKYDILKLYTDKIEKRLKVLEKQVKDYRKERTKQKEKTRKEIMKDKEISARDILIKQMQFELKKQRDLAQIYNTEIQKEQEFNTIKTTNKLPVIIIDKFSKKGIELAHREFGLKDQVIFFRDFSYSVDALKALINFKPKAILNFDKRYLSVLKKHNIKSVDIEPVMHDYYGSIEAKQIE